MPEFLILRLRGVMQAWGRHTYEDFRPVELFPTRSGLVGLLGACLGIDRAEPGRLRDLSESFAYAARSDARTRSEFKTEKPLLPRKITDYHTILEPRLVPGSTRKGAVVSPREYLCDAHFTVALQSHPEAVFSLEEIRAAVKKPVYTPTLGRRSCPLTHPLLEPGREIVVADDLQAALALVPPHRGTIYSQIQGDSPNRYAVRDVPTGHPKRQFAARTIFIHAETSFDPLEAFDPAEENEE